jgi:hypothetical protein
MLACSWAEKNGLEVSDVQEREVMYAWRKNKFRDVRCVKGMQLMLWYVLVSDNMAG